MGIDSTCSPNCRRNETSSKVAPARAARIGAAGVESRFPGSEVCMMLGECWYSADVESQVACEAEQGSVFLGAEVEGAGDRDVQLGVEAESKILLVSPNFFKANIDHNRKQDREKLTKEMRISCWGGF